MLTLVYVPSTISLVGTRWRSWLRHCATSRKVAGSIPDGVIGIFYCQNPSCPHYGTGVDLTSNRNEYQEYFLEFKGGRCEGLTTLPPSCADFIEIWESQTHGKLRACSGLQWNCFTFFTASLEQPVSVTARKSNRQVRNGKVYPCRTGGVALVYRTTCKQGFRL